jgi:hypothetical protein
MKTIRLPECAAFQGVQLLPGRSRADNRWRLQWTGQQGEWFELDLRFRDGLRLLHLVQQLKDELGFPSYVELGGEAGDR